MYTDILRGIFQNIIDKIYLYGIPSKMTVFSVHIRTEIEPDYIAKQTNLTRKYQHHVIIYCHTCPSYRDITAISHINY